MLERVKPEYISKTYQIDSWSSTDDFIEQMARRMGRLLKVSVMYVAVANKMLFCVFHQGGEPDVNAVSKIVLNDFQRGRLPYFVKPMVRIYNNVLQCDFFFLQGISEESSQDGPSVSALKGDVCSQCYIRTCYYWS